jgi:hypothetical protein
MASCRHPVLVFYLWLFALGAELLFVALNCQINPGYMLRDRQSLHKQFN